MKRSLRILLVEDHADTQHVMSRLLQSCRHDVKAASSIASALALASQHPFDLVISDLGLPDGSGAAMMGQLRNQYNIPGIAVSGYSAHEIQASERSGFAAHLIKPITMEQLERAIQTTIGDDAKGSAGDPISWGADRDAG